MVSQKKKKDGSTCFFRTDVWKSRLLSSQYPELFSFAKDQNISVQSFISLLDMDMSDLFHLPLSTQAYSQFQQLVIIMADTILQEGNDTWSYIWDSSVFASSKANSHLTGRHVHLAYKWLWNSSCQPRRKFFLWLLLKDRLSTCGLLKRRNMELESYSCVLCHFDTEKTMGGSIYTLQGAGAPTKI